MFKILNIFVLLFLVQSISLPVFAQCPPGSHYVRLHHRSGYVRYDGTAVSPTMVSAHCRSNSSAYNKWIDKFVDSAPSKWPYKEKFKKWSEEDKHKIISAFEKLPEFLWKNSNRKIYRAEKSIESSNPATSATKSIVIYDSAFNNKQSLQRIIAHELAHELYDSDLQLAKDYRLAMGWGDQRIGGKTIIFQRKSGYVEKDGSNAPEEDFANNMEYFLFEPNKLKAITLPAYNWIKWRYDGKLKPINKTK